MALIEQLELSDSIHRIDTLSKLPDLRAWEEQELNELIRELHAHITAGGKLPDGWLSRNR